jgi:acetyl-CoA/propionyl-CoA carboxylase biotin carboxyl carrier protein
VEHPVTECVTGVDLVRTQLLVAGGERLPFEQAGLTQRGHAIECRVYAEDPARGFLPQAGRVLLYREPQGPGIRVDSGVVEGTDVTVHYDPMLAKVIVIADTREAARRRAVAALRDYAVLGIHTNISFLLSVLEHPSFVAATIDTGFLDREGPALASAPEPPLPDAVVSTLGTLSTGGTSGTRGSDPFSSLFKWRG